MSKKQFIPVGAEMAEHEKLKDLKRQYHLGSMNDVLKMLIRFFESNWQDNALLDEIVAKIREEK